MAVRERTKNRILAHASKHYAGKYTRLDVHFRGQLCYIDAYTEPSVPPGFDPAVFGESREEYLQRLREIPTHLCRLRYFGDVKRTPSSRQKRAIIKIDYYTYEPKYTDAGV
jgi:hypothetical protein